MIARHKTLTAQDSKIESSNKKLKSSHATLGKADTRLTQAQYRATRDSSNEKNIEDLSKAAARAKAGAAFTKAAEDNAELIGTVSGRVMILLPAGTAPGLT